MAKPKGQRKAGRPRKKIGRKSQNSGRKRKNTVDASVYVKYNRAHELIHECKADKEIISLALEILKEENKYKKAFAILKICDNNVQTLEIALKLIDNAKNNDEDKNNRSEAETDENSNEINNNKVIRHSKESAFAFYVNNDFTKAKWINLHRDCRARYPSYGAILKVKKDCYPKDMLITKSSVLIPLQSLLDKTAERYVKYFNRQNPDLTKTK